MFKILRNLTKKDLFLLFLAILGVILQVWLELKMPDYMATITQLVETEGSELTEILQNGVMMLLCAGGSMLSAIAVSFVIANFAADFSRNIRQKLFAKIISLSQNEIKQFSVPSLVTRSTNDITQIQMFCSMGLQMIIKAPITAVWAVTKIINKSWQWSLATGVGVIIVVSTILTLMVFILPRFKLVQKLIDKTNSVSRENLTGIRVVRAFNAEAYQEAKFDDVNQALTKTQLFNQRLFQLMSPVMYLVMYFLTLTVYLIGANLIDAANPFDKLGIFSDMVVFSSYAGQVISSFLMLATVFMFAPRAQVSATRINEVMDTPISVKEGNKQVLAKNERSACKTAEIMRAPEIGTVEFKNVSFKYPDAEDYLLKDISFKAKKGETVAFIGSTGSGKSTLINLIPRFYDATEGEVLVDGVNVKEYTFESLNNKIGLVPQKAVLFSGTIKSNTRFGDNGRAEVSVQKVKDAIKVAQGQDFVEALKEQYDAHVAQGGTNFSGGQKQRLAIARAVARDPEIYIFDDSFSALDYQTDANLRRSLKKFAHDATCLIVAQRIGTIMFADHIIVLENGRAVGQGTHQELLKTCQVYREIAESQLSKEEL